MLIAKKQEKKNKAISALEKRLKNKEEEQRNRKKEHKRKFNAIERALSAKMM